ncbi:hypothetical protein C8R44DRAFT_653693, partial [Mycena epipterygia]
QPKPRAPLTNEEKKEKNERQLEKQSGFNHEVGEWLSYTYTQADWIAEKYSKPQQYVLDVFFQGGAHMVHHQQKVNPYNAFKSEKAAECREGAWLRPSPRCYTYLRSYLSFLFTAGETKNAAQIHEDHFVEYSELTDEQKDELCKRYSSNRVSVPLRRDTPRDKIQDVVNIVRNMQLLVRTPSFLLMPLISSKDGGPQHACRC